MLSEDKGPFQLTPSSQLNHVKVEMADYAGYPEDNGCQPRLLLKFNISRLFTIRRACSWAWWQAKL